MNVLIVDDHSYVRQRIREILQEAFDDAVCGEAGDGQEALDKARERPWDIVVLDIGLPVVNGLVVLKVLKHQKPGLQVLIFTIYADNAFASQCLKDGAAAYLCKPGDAVELVDAMRAVLAGGTFVSRELALGPGLPPSAGKPPWSTRGLNQ